MLNLLKMIKLLFISTIFTFLFIVTSCDNKKNQQGESKVRVEKCPNCRSANIQNWQGGPDNSMKECLNCGIAFRRCESLISWE